jgi:hypothetical protein
MCRKNKPEHLNQKTIENPAIGKDNMSASSSNIVQYIYTTVSVGMGFKFPVTGFELPVIGFEFPITGFEFPVTGFVFPVTGFEFPVMGFVIRVDIGLSSNRKHKSSINTKQKYKTNINTNIKYKIGKDS